MQISKKNFLQLLINEVSELDELRDDARTTYPIHEIILLALLSIFSGVIGWRKMVIYGG
jgi:hypothetical protein